jgi:hypothetical protein
MIARPTDVVHGHEMGIYKRYFDLTRNSPTSARSIPPEREALGVVAIGIGIELVDPPRPA